MGVEQKGLAILEQAVGVLQVGLALANALDLGPAQGDAGLEAIFKEVVEGGRPVKGGIARAHRDGIAVLRLHRAGFGHGGDCRVGEGAGHTRRVRRRRLLGGAASPAMYSDASRWAILHRKL